MNDDREKDRENKDGELSTPDYYERVKRLAEKFGGQRLGGSDIAHEAFIRAYQQGVLGEDWAPKDFHDLQRLITNERKRRQRTPRRVLSLDDESTLPMAALVEYDSAQEALIREEHVSEVSDLLTETLGAIQDKDRAIVLNAIPELVKLLEIDISELEEPDLPRKPESRRKAVYRAKGRFMKTAETIARKRLEESSHADRQTYRTIYAMVVGLRSR